MPAEPGPGAAPAIQTHSLEGPHAPEEQARGRSPAAEGDLAVNAMETLVSQVLRYGVLLSFSIVLLGSLWLFVSRHTGYADLSTAGNGALDALTHYHPGHQLATSSHGPGDILRGVLSGKAYAIITLGLVVLIATPVLRVAVSVVTFLRERDRLYALITAYVLAVLLASFVLGKSG